ncbi:MAG: recombinase family protein [Candidatus Sumerlaeota bacterium]|nr:recombinase family protein [Candidatus Sumerlaeota bacterium]
MKELYRKSRKGERRSMADIALMLNQEGLPTRTGRPWNPGTVRALLKREKAAPRETEEKASRRERGKKAGKD